MINESRQALRIADRVGVLLPARLDTLSLCNCSLYFPLSRSGCLSERPIIEYCGGRWKILRSNIITNNNNSKLVYLTPINTKLFPLLAGKKTRKLKRTFCVFSSHVFITQRISHLNASKVPQPSFNLSLFSISTFLIFLNLLLWP